ncbi:LamG-like jellyroll fold domain-containing protein [Oligosphaera ethanolica]|uniref:LamG-like jellyroll fold domain-containing protein n=1 Tax=Oligosphaera ethanolica TaxID=760260 RepID=A0AAE3VDG7_9BACT|nr:LamG-like jellyroll fold domain-containing protein [Oligosphaera ethanolica]MDQ0288199.1 hypothetical protein [Oligosphaera ethanolica]
MRERLLMCVLMTVMACCQAQDAMDRGVIFHATFDDGVEATSAAGARAPLRANGYELVPGLGGQAVKVPAGGVLSYDTAGNLDLSKGTLSFWLQRPVLSAERLEELRSKWSARQLFGLFLQRGGGINVRVGFADTLVVEQSGQKLSSGIYGSWRAGTWHHVAVTWDCQNVTSLYMDGQFLPQGGETFGGMPMRLPFEPESPTEMFIGCLGESRQSDIAMDEIRIYNRVLSAEEIAATVKAYWPLHVLVLPQVLMPGSNRLQATVTNMGREDLAAKQLTWELRDAAGTILRQGAHDAPAMPHGAETAFAIDFTPPASGEYSLSIRSGDDARFDNRLPLYLPTPAPARVIAPEPQPQLERVDYIDCSQELPPGRFMARGESRLVDSPLGRYREASLEKWSRLVYTVNVKAVQEPHLVTVRYPDDRARCVFVQVRNEKKKTGFTLQAGWSVGNEFPNTHQVQTARYLWWPMEERNALMFCSWFADQPAAVLDITVERIVGGNAGVPALRVNEPAGEPGRMMAIEWEDASLASNFGFDRVPEFTLARFENLTDRLIAYMGFAGMDTLVYPATFYFGPMCRHPKTTGLGNRLEQHPEGWLELLMDRFAGAGLTCYPALNFHSTPTLVAENCDDPLAIAAGQDTYFQVPYDGVIPRYSRGDSTLNPLHPRVQQQTLEIIEGIVARCETRSSYAGIQLCFWPHRQIPFCFISARHGYGDTTIRQFTQDTGIAVPGADNDPERFYKRYRFLLSEHRDAWLDWRCQKIADYVRQIAALARRTNPDAQVLIPLLQEAWPSPNEFPFYRKLLHGRSTVEEEWRERGVDLRLLASIPGVLLKRQTRDAMRRYWDRPEARTSRDNASSWDNARPFREIPSGAYPFNHYYEHSWEKVPVDGAWWEDGWSAGTANGGGRYYLERSAWSLFLQDAQALSRGACSVEAQASIWESREFGRAYRTLPARPFTSWTATPTEPAAVREYAGKDGHYVYAVNAMYCPLAVSLTLKGATSVLDLVTGESIAAADGVLRLELRPYELRTFRAAHGAALTAVEVDVPADVLAGLSAGLAKLREDNASNQAGWLEESRQAHQQLIADIDGHLQARRYYQAWRLLESERATRVAQPASAAPEHALVLPAATQEPAAGAVVARLNFDDQDGAADLASRGFSMNERGSELFVLREGVGRGGSRCLALAAGNKDYVSLATELTPALAPGYDFVLRFWLRADAPRVAPFMLRLEHGSGAHWNYRLNPTLSTEWQQLQVVITVPPWLPGEPVPENNALRLILRSNSYKGVIFPTTFLLDDLELQALGPQLDD